MTQQGQKAGSHASQVQVAGDLVVMQGVTESRAREIAREVAEGMLAAYGAESHAVAEERIGAFNAALVERLAQEDLLGALGDPAVQVTLRKAQVGAASTERGGDYELLASLLEDRAKRGGERPVRAGINRAVEVVDQLDARALTGLTVLQAALQFCPLGGTLETGLATMDRLLAELMQDEQMPSGLEWIEHLDVLGVARLESGPGFMPFDNFWPEKTPGYLAVGVKAGGEDEARVVTGFAKAACTVELLDHELKEGYRRLPYTCSQTFEKEVRASHPLTEAQIGAVMEVANRMLRVDEIDATLRDAFMARVRTLPMQAALADWWDGLPRHFSITPVGRVLARANAQRLDVQQLLPPLD